MAAAPEQSTVAAGASDTELPTLAQVLVPVRRHWLKLFLLPLLVGVITYGLTFLLTPKFKSVTTFLPPQQQQSSAASALAALGPLSALAGVGGGLRTPADQYVSLMQSVTVSDRLVTDFKLMDVYRVEIRQDARRKLEENVQMSVGKKDGLISVTVMDTSPERAAQMANRYVDELRRMSGTLAITEAQQRRAFFQRLLEQSREQLLKAQLALQGSGFNSGALKSEPKAAAESYARLKAEVAATEVKLQSLRGRLADGTPEVQQLVATLRALRGQLAAAEQPVDNTGGPDYVSKYREFKYQEALFEVYARQFELARVDESREGALIQVIDVATPAEMRSFPKRGMTTVSAAAAAFCLVLVWLYLAPALGPARPRVDKTRPR